MVQRVKLQCFNFGVEFRKRDFFRFTSIKFFREKKLGPEEKLCEESRKMGLTMEQYNLWRSEKYNPDENKSNSDGKV